MRMKRRIVPRMRTTRRNVPMLRKRRRIDHQVKPLRKLRTVVLSRMPEGTASKTNVRNGCSEENKEREEPTTRIPQRREGRGRLHNRLHYLMHRQPTETRRKLPTTVGTPRQRLPTRTLATMETSPSGVSGEATLRLCRMQVSSTWRQLRLRQTTIMRPSVRCLSFRRRLVTSHVPPKT